MNLFDPGGRDLEQGSILHLMEPMSISVDDETPGLQLGPSFPSCRWDELTCDLQGFHIQGFGHEPEVGK